MSITSATLSKTTATDASGNPQTYCAVVGTINGGRAGFKATGQTDAQTTYAIGFQINLPSTWNSRLFFSGGGGTDGSIPDTTGVITDGEAVNPLLSGYATVSDDSGHTDSVNSDPNNAGSSAFGLDPQARLDFGYNAIGQTKQLANQLIARYYGKKQDYAYFMGCSEGGREAMMVSQRFGNEFDGVVAGDPGSDLPKAWLAEAWDTQQFAAAAAAQGFFENGQGASANTPLLSSAFTSTQWSAMQNAILAKCDADDGLVDGMINKACTFDVSTLACNTTGAPAAPNCLSTAQVTAMQKVMGGPKNSAGDALYADWPWDVGIGAPGWLIWKVGIPGAFGPPGVNGAINVTLGGGAGPLVFTSPPTQGLSTANSLVQYQLHFDWNNDAPKITATSGIYSTSAYDFMGTHSTDLSTLKNKGGKLIVYHGTSDPVFSFNYTANWYNALSQTAANGTVRDFARLFPVPGMNHCSGGPATDSFPAFTAVVNWVEKGQAPDRLIASSSTTTPAQFGWTLPAGATTRVRPLCPYPQHAQYTGATDSSPAALIAQNDPANYVCTP